MSPYSQETTIKALTSYYAFLQNIHLKPHVVIYPPSQGWPSITPQTLSPLNKTPEIISLLKHIPYFSQPQGDPAVLARKTWPIPYNSSSLHQDILNKEEKNYTVEPIYNISLTSHAICLAKGGRDGYYIILDTERNVIVWGCPADPWGNGATELTPKDIDAEGPDGWMCGETYDVQEFFEMLKGKWRRGEWLKHPSGQTDVYESAPEGHEDEQREFLKGVLENYGWPGDENGEGWDKEGAEDELSERYDEWDDL